MKIKYHIKKNFNLILFTISLTILLSQIIYSIYSNYNNEPEKIIGKVDTYAFWNLVEPNEENIKIIKNFDNILPINCNEDNNDSEEYSSIIYELIKNLNKKLLLLNKK